MDGLEQYRRKRRFERTPEPAPAKGTGNKEGFFVVQKHAARRLHYDFRLAVEGVLKSWAVPKGPSLNPGEKRLAIQTEDHPMDYANFEGTIPPGSYGAGTVMVWDRGSFEPEREVDAGEQLRRGELKFRLEGEKLRGGFVLVRLKHGSSENQWLLIKHKDASAEPGWNVNEHDGSVLTGRTIDQIAQGLPAVKRTRPPGPADLPGARKVPMPSWIKPMLAKLVEKPFSNPDWLFEIKWDGVRALAWVADGKLTLRSRLGNDITSHFPELAELPGSLGARRAVLDGEIVVLDKRGRSSFGDIQQRVHVRKPSPGLLSQASATYFAFDLLYCDGYDLRSVPLADRKELLRRLLRPRERIRYSDHQVGLGKELFDLAREQGLEGIVGKRLDSAYVGSRSGAWVKLKANKMLDAVVAGWTAPRAGRTDFGSLILGLSDGKKLRFVGHVGTGFDENARAEILAFLERHRTLKCPFDDPPETNEKPFWTRPRLVARVRFSDWTKDRRLRQPVFISLREDAHPEDCRWRDELPGHSPEPTRSAPTVIRRVLTNEAQIESELQSGRKDHVVIELDGKRFRLTNLNKIYFPNAGYTKRDLLAYYYRMANYILPFLKERPLVLRRYPDGIQGESFFQKDLRRGVPDWLETVAIQSERESKAVHYAIANDRATLLFLTGLGCIDHNPWSSRRHDLDHPDYVFFDLDPAAGTEFSVVVAVARAIYERLAALGLKLFLKTSGATGFHIYLPVAIGYTYDQLRTFAEIVARLAASDLPRSVTWERAVQKRPAGHVLIDVQQNALGRPLAAPYSVRPFPRAPVSAPVLPSELQPRLTRGMFHLKSMFSRVEQIGDPWASFWDTRQRIEGALDQLLSQSK